MPEDMSRRSVLTGVAAASAVTAISGLERASSANAAPPDPAALAAIEEIRLLKARYFRFLDTKDTAAWRELFTPDLHAEADGSTFDDRDAFVDTVSGLLADVRSAHHGHMPEIRVTGPSTATGIWAMQDLLVFPGDPPKGIRGNGHYHERYRRSGGTWRIERLVLTRLYVEPLAGGFPVGGPWPL